MPGPETTHPYPQTEFPIERAAVFAEPAFTPSTEAYAQNETTLGVVNHHLRRVYVTLAEGGRVDDVGEHMKAVAEVIRGTEGSYSPVELLTSLRYANEIDGMTDGRSEGWRLLDGAEPGKLKELMDMDYNREAPEPTALIGGILKRGAASANVVHHRETAEAFIGAAENAFVALRGPRAYCQFWLKDGKPAVPEYMKPIVDGPHFLPYAIDSHINRLERKSVVERDRQLGFFEQHMLTEMLGLPEQM